ncbi:MAG TPA: zinc-ribbon domain-containing protein [Gammaproteobacteria bacterium]|nr:zinc-ribbon domain-containing protein [Gammaproteobacteria bacterium]
MPELPDVEVFKRYFDATALHGTIAGLEVEDPGILAEGSPEDLERRVQGRSLETSRRHGKRLFAGLNDGHWLEFHFGMSGSLAYFKEDDDAPPYTRALFRMDNGCHLAFVEPRKLGHLALVADLEAYLRELGLGPDAYALSEEAFRELARGHRGQVKCWLMDQGEMAGIGNVYSDEILFHAGMPPKRPLNSLSGVEIGDLYRALRGVIEAAVATSVQEENMPADFLVPRREAGASCPRCGGSLEAVKACGRTAYYCPSCQPDL